MHAPSTTAPRPIWRDPRAHALLLAATLNIMTNATVSPALPGLAAEFAGAPDTALLLPLLVSAPSLTVALAAPFCGAAVDRWGRRPLLVLGVVLFALVGTAGLVLPTLGGILASRFLLGLPMALIMTAQTALLGDIYAGEARGRFSSYQFAAINWGGFVFIMLASTLAGQSARLPFAVYALPLLFTPFMWRVLAGAEAPGRRPAAGTAGEGRRGWGYVVAVAAGGQILTGALFFLMPTQIPFAAEARGLDGAATTGLVLGTLMLAGGVGALGAQPLRMRFGRAATMALGFAAMGAGFAALAGAATGPAMALAGAAIGAGFGTVSPHFVTLALDAAPAARRGMTAGIVTMSMYLGRFLSPFGSEPMIAAHGFAVTYDATAVVFAVFAVCAAAAGAAHLVTRES